MYILYTIYIYIYYSIGPIIHAKVIWVVNNTSFLIKYMYIEYVLSIYNQVTCNVWHESSTQYSNILMYICATYIIYLISNYYLLFDHRSTLHIYNCLSKIICLTV